MSKKSARNQKKPAQLPLPQRYNMLQNRKPRFELFTKFVREWGSLVFLAGGFAALSTHAATVFSVYLLSALGYICLIASWMLTHDFTASFMALDKYTSKLTPNKRLAAEFIVILAAVLVNALVVQLAVESLNAIWRERVGVTQGTFEPRSDK